MPGKPDIDDVIKALIALRDACKESKIEVVEVLGFSKSGTIHHSEKKERVEIDVRLLVTVGKG